MTIADPRSNREPIEVIVVSSQDSIGQVADRIERAYLRRYSKWNPVGLTPFVWVAAASRLMEAAEAGSGVPIDPELFVSVQARSRLTPNPWVELTQERSLEVYLRAVRRIVVLLRRELRSEIRWAQRRMKIGQPLEKILSFEGSGITPLACYIIAHRAGRHDLSLMHRAAAENQHRSCPLYRLASRPFLPSRDYPFSDLSGGPAARPGEVLAAFSVN